MFKKKEISIIYTNKKYIKINLLFNKIKIKNISNYYNFKNKNNPEKF